MQKSMRLFAAFSLLGLTASPAVAERPTIEYLDLPSGLSFTLSGVCTFDVFEELLGNKEKIATFSRSEWRHHISGLDRREQVAVHKCRYREVHRRERVWPRSLFGAARQRHRPGADGRCVVLDVSTRYAAARLARLSADQRVASWRNLIQRRSRS